MNIGIDGESDETNTLRMDDRGCVRRRGIDGNLERASIRPTTRLAGDAYGRAI